MIADDWLEAGPNRAVGQRSPPMEGRDKETPTSDLTGIIIIILNISREVTPHSNSLGERLCVHPELNYMTKVGKRRSERSAQRDHQGTPHQNILRKNTLVDSIILTSSPAFIFKNSSSVTEPTALKGSRLPSGMSFQLPFVCAKAA